jgi:CRP-like cAMP-binding protein
VLSSLSDEFLEVTVDFLETKKYGTGEMIIKEGELGSEFYIIQSGKVAFTHDGDSSVGGQTKYIRFMHAQDSFGEIALLEECRRTCNAVCMSPVVCFSLAKPFFDLVSRLQV